MLNTLLIGWITVMSSVGGADVMIDENDGIQMHGKQICIEVTAGRHLIMVDKEGYYPYLDTITIGSGHKECLEVWLEPKSNHAIKRTSNFDRIKWDYQLANGINTIRWVGIGAGLGTGLNLHISLFDMRFGLLTIEPCTWGLNVPFYSNVTHIKTPWLIHQRDRREDMRYEVAISSQEIQWYYTPMIGAQIPMMDHVAFILSAGPQMSWTKIKWTTEWRENPFTHSYTFTDAPFPKTSYQYDPIWFAAQAGIIYTASKSDLLTYFKYQDGFFIGMEVRF